MPHTSIDNGGTFDVKTGRFERRIVRNALNQLKADLEANQKKDKALDAPNETIEAMIACIDGGNGWGSGLYKKFQEQMEMPAAGLFASTEAEQGKARAVRAASDHLNELFAPLGFTLERDTIAAWSDDQRGQARVWALAWGTRGRDDKDPTALAEVAPLFLLDELKMIALAERELQVGEVSALVALLEKAEVQLSATGAAALLARTPEERAEARAWAEAFIQAAAVVDQTAEESPEYAAAEETYRAVNGAIPVWLEALYDEHAATATERPDVTPIVRALAASGVMVAEDALVAASPEQRDNALTWLDGYELALAAWQKKVTKKTTAALEANESAMPSWLRGATLRITRESTAPLEGETAPDLVSDREPATVEA